MDKKIFVYGTLCDKDVLKVVAGSSHHTHISHGKIPGYSAKYVKGKSYPALLQEENGICFGEIYIGFSKIAWQRMVYFEGDEYTLREMDVLDKNQRPVKALLFIPVAEVEVTDVYWNRQKWMINEKETYINHVRFFMQGFDKK